MPGKKWCEYCRINLPYDKKSIQDHQATRMHTQNKQKHIKFERIKIKNQEKAAKAVQQANSLMSTANIPKAKKGSQLEQQVQQYRNDVIMSGKLAISQLIAERTKGLYGAPIQYPQKEDLVLAENYQDPQEVNNQNQGEENEGKFEMWKIDVCEQTGKACFINRITQAKVYEPPKGYIMSQQQKQQWQQTLKICNQIPQNIENAGEVGQWEQVQQEQDYFMANKAQSEQQSQQNQANLQSAKALKNQQNNPNIKQQVKVQENAANIQNKPQSWLDQLHQKVKNNQLNQQQVIGAMLTNTLDECRTVKQKNQALKKLIKNDFEIRTTLDKGQSYLKDESEKDGNQKSIGIKPRKKVKTCQLVQDKDIV